MQLVQRQLRLALAVLLASAAVLLAVGTTVEHHQPNKTTQATTPVSGATTGGQAGEDAHAGNEAGEQRGEDHDQLHGPGESGSTQPTASAAGEQDSGERFLGVAESLPLTIAAVAASLALAVAIWVRPARLVIWAVLLVALVLAAADGRELAHHLHEARTALATIAGVLLAMHLTAACLATLLAMASPSPTAVRTTAGG